MAEFERGQTFHDSGACNLGGTKGKYFIALSSATYDDDRIVCFVMNTEHRMDKLQLGCNPTSERYIIPPKTFSFVTLHTAIMLNIEATYTLREMYDDNIRLLDKVDDTLSRRIKNCINRDHITPKYYALIAASFK